MRKVAARSAAGEASAGKGEEAQFRYTEAKAHHYWAPEPVYVPAPPKMIDRAFAPTVYHARREAQREEAEKEARGKSGPPAEPERGVHTYVYVHPGHPPPRTKEWVQWVENGRHRAWKRWAHAFVDAERAQQFNE